jgi:hypothetical protein
MSHVRRRHEASHHAVPCRPLLCHAVPCCAVPTPAVLCAVCCARRRAGPQPRGPRGPPGPNRLPPVRGALGGWPLSVIAAACAELRSHGVLRVETRGCLLGVWGATCVLCCVYTCVICVLLYVCCIYTCIYVYVLCCVVWGVTCVLWVYSAGHGQLRRHVAHVGRGERHVPPGAGTTGRWWLQVQACMDVYGTHTCLAGTRGWVRAALQR